jgi:hypothetical protein
LLRSGLLFLVWTIPLLLVGIVLTIGGTQGLEKQGQNADVDASERCHGVDLPWPRLYVTEASVMRESPAVPKRPTPKESIEYAFSVP